MRLSLVFQSLCANPWELDPDIQELYNYFFSSGFIKPKKKGTKPKPTPQQMEQYYTVLNLRFDKLRKHLWPYGQVRLAHGSTLSDPEI